MQCCQPIFLFLLDSKFCWKKCHIGWNYPHPSDKFTICFTNPESTNFFRNYFSFKGIQIVFCSNKRLLHHFSSTLISIEKFYFIEKQNKEYFMTFFPRFKIGENMWWTIPKNCIFPHRHGLQWICFRNIFWCHLWVHQRNWDSSWGILLGLYLLSLGRLFDNSWPEIMIE